MRRTKYRTSADKYLFTYPAFVGLAERDIQELLLPGSGPGLPGGGLRDACTVQLELMERGTRRLSKVRKIAISIFFSLKKSKLCDCENVPYKPVLGNHDILVWIRILLFPSLTFNTQTKY
jgi:hypothetical protein